MSYLFRVILIIQNEAVKDELKAAQADIISIGLDQVSIYLLSCTNFENDCKVPFTQKQINIIHNVI